MVVSKQCFPHGAKGKSETNPILCALLTLLEKDIELGKPETNPMLWALLT